MLIETIAVGLRVMRKGTKRPLRASDSFPSLGGGDGDEVDNTPGIAAAMRAFVASTRRTKRKPD